MLRRNSSVNICSICKRFIVGQGNLCRRFRITRKYRRIQWSTSVDDVSLIIVSLHMRVAISYMSKSHFESFVYEGANRLKPTPSSNESYDQLLVNCQSLSVSGANVWPAVG